VKQAVLIVGLEAIKNLVLSASVLDMFKGQKVDHDFQERFWRHSLATASCTRLLARRVRSRGIVDPDTAFSAGLLHDVGKMVISAFLPTEFARLTQARETDTTLTDHHLEQQTLGYSHAEIGGLVAVHWKLPQRLGNAITFHHSLDPSRVENVLVALVQLGNFLAKQTFYEPSEEHLVGMLEPVVLEYLQLVQDDLDGFIDTLREEYVKAQTFAQMAGIG